MTESDREKELFREHVPTLRSCSNGCKRCWPCMNSRKDHWTSRHQAVELGPTLEQFPSTVPGTQIGPYKLLQPIGGWGMGTVCMAEQQEPVRRRVAMVLPFNFLCRQSAV